MNINKLPNEQRKIQINPTHLRVLYKNGMTVMELARRFGVSNTPIRRILKEANASMRKVAPRPGVMSGAKNPQWKGGKRTRRDGYILLWTPDGDKLEHRVIMENFLGRPLSRKEVVHHKDGNPSNNTIQNLELLASQSVHFLGHAEQNRNILLKNGMKQCTKCLIVQPIASFYKTKYNRMGIQSWCKQCKNKYDAIRRNRK